MKIGAERLGIVEVSIRRASPRRGSDLVVHRRPSLRREDCGSFEGIPVTSPVQTLIDISPRLGRLRVERVILDRRTFRLTREELERRFLPLAREVGLPVPLTRRWVNGFEVDFLWPELGFLVETDGLRYHRTPAEQARDRVRDQAHTAAGFVHLRFTHEQVRYEPDHVRATLVATARLLPGPAARGDALADA